MKCESLYYTKELSELAGYLVSFVTKLQMSVHEKWKRYSIAIIAND